MRPIEIKKAIKVNGNEIQKKIDTVEEKYFVTGEMSKETYGKFIAKLTTEKQEILASLQNTSVSSSNLEEHLETVSSFSLKLATAWTFSPVKEKEKLQNLVFPEGISYCTKMRHF